MGTFSLGLSTLTFVVPLEIFPLRYRAKGFGLGWALNRIVSGLVSASYPTLSDKFGAPSVFFVYGIIAFLSAVFIF